MRARLVILMLAAGVIIGVAACGTPKANAVKDLFAQFGWIVLGEPVEADDILPAEFKVCPGFPWRVYLDLSKDSGLDFSPLAEDGAVPGRGLAGRAAEGDPRAVSSLGSCCA